MCAFPFSLPSWPASVSAWPSTGWSPSHPPRPLSLRPGRRYRLGLSAPGETHGGILTILPNGIGTDHLRTYVPCTSTRLTACDRIVKGEIYPGEYDEFHITSVQGNT